MVACLVSALPPCHCECPGTGIKRSRLKSVRAMEAGSSYNSRKLFVHTRPHYHTGGRENMNKVLYGYCAYICVLSTQDAEEAE